MSFPTYPLVLASSSASGPTLATSAVQTSVTPLTGFATIPANTLQVGSLLRVQARGRLTTQATPGTLTWALFFGSVSVFTPAAVTLSTTAVASGAFLLDINLVIRSIGNGTSATALGIASVVSPAYTGGVSVLPAAANPAVGSGFDSTAAQLVDLKATWGTSSATNTIIVEQMLVELKV